MSSPFGLNVIVSFRVGDGFKAAASPHVNGGGAAAVQSERQQGANGVSLDERESLPWSDRGVFFKLKMFLLVASEAAGC